jgi:hypothetical protein
MINIFFRFKASSGTDSKYISFSFHPPGIGKYMLLKFRRTFLKTQTDFKSSSFILGRTQIRSRKAIFFADFMLKTLEVTLIYFFEVSCSL